MLEKLIEIDSIKLNFSEGGKDFLNYTIALIMLGVALELKIEDFKKLWKNPLSTFTGIVSQFLLLPAFSFVLVYLLRHHITPTVGLGMILVASCPGGNVSNFISSLAKGNIALSVSLTAFSSLAAILFTPMNFAFWGNLFLSVYEAPSGLTTLPSLSIDLWEVLRTIVLILGIPLFLGLFFSTKFPKTTAKIQVTVKRFSILAFAAIVILIFSNNYELFLKYIFYIFILVLLHNSFAMFLGYFSAYLVKLQRPDRRTIAIETGIQNTGLALALLFNPAVFPAELKLGGMAFIAAWWGIWHILSGMTLAGIWTGFNLKTAEIGKQEP